MTPSGSCEICSRMPAALCTSRAAIVCLGLRKKKIDARAADRLISFLRLANRLAGFRRQDGGQPFEHRVSAHRENCCMHAEARLQGRWPPTPVVRRAPHDTLQQPTARRPAEARAIVAPVGRIANSQHAHLIMPRARWQRSGNLQDRVARQRLAAFPVMKFGMPLHGVHV